jgi:spore germination cell wall hydrolase CwlJ-like protein
MKTRTPITAALIASLLTAPCALAYADQRQDIARTIAAEACSEGITGMRLVAETINNRSKAQHKTPYQIISAKNQYYGYTAKTSYKLYDQCKASADQVTNELLAGNTGDKTKGALYFINPKTEKPFRWCKVLTYAFKNHVFYK